MFFEDGGKAVSVDESGHGGCTGGGGAIVGFAGNDAAQSEDLAGSGDEQRFGVAITGREELIDFAGVDDVDAAGLFALPEKNASRRPSLGFFEARQRPDDRFAQYRGL